MANTDRPDRTCILTVQADRPGGVPTVVDWWHTFLTHWGHQPTVLYAAFEGEGINYWQRLMLTLRMWRLHPRPEHPHPTLANAPLPAPLWMFYFVPQWVFGGVLDRFDQIVVAGGPCLHALPLALRRMPYVLWIGTLYEDELRGKTLIGDKWARRVLKSPTWPILAGQERLVLRRASQILAQSPYTRRRILETAPEVADRLDLAMVPVDDERFRPLPPQARAETQEQYLLNISRINDPRKNIPLLLEAFARIAARYPALKLVLAGDEPQPALLSQCERLGIGGSVIFRGKVPPDELAELYQRAELFVISSTQEGLGIVMLEAMACGTPVVATDCGGPEGIVIDGETGRLVPNNEPEALTAVILDLLDHPARLEAMRERCTAFVRQNCTRPVVERTLYSHFARAFPASQAAHRNIFEVRAPAPDAGATKQKASLREGLALAWAVVVLAAYVQHQAAIHGASIWARLIKPLLSAMR